MELENIILSEVNKAAMNVVEQVSMYYGEACFEYMIRSGITGF